MRKALLIILVIILGGAGGFGLAYLVSQRLPLASVQSNRIIINPNTPYEGPGYGRGRGMMGPFYDNNETPNPSGTRITMDKAVQAVDTAVSSMGSDFQVAEVMQFQDNFYAVVLEKSTGRGAFELLVDPYTAAVSYEPGPNMMWNLKYGPMGKTLVVTQDNSVTAADAKNLAQQALNDQAPGATVEGNGYDFYGYYTFDYQVNGQIAGMLSVNGLNGQVWFHTWHGAFVSEEELVNE